MCVNYKTSGWNSPKIIPNKFHPIFTASCWKLGTLLKFSCLTPAVMLASSSSCVPSLGQPTSLTTCNRINTHVFLRVDPCLPWGFH